MQSRSDENIDDIFVFMVIPVCAERDQKKIEVFFPNDLDFRRLSFEYRVEHCYHI